jgi:selenocysteine lyase/cysteine desulfurase
VVEDLSGEGVLATSQGGWVRIAPHFYLTDDDMEKVASVLSRVA